MFGGCGSINYQNQSEAQMTFTLYVPTYLDLSNHKNYKRNFEKLNVAHFEALAWYLVSPGFLIEFYRQLLKL